MILVVSWSTFGPYHIARLNALHHYKPPFNIRTFGLEIAGLQTTYAWQKKDLQCKFEGKSVFPTSSFEQISNYPILLMRSIWRSLDEIKPDIIAVNGYSTLDAWTMVAWGRFHSRKLILMSESKANDAHRAFSKEIVKRFLLKQVGAALCAGSDAQEYLVSLGMPQGRIFLGYDAVDNDYFWNASNEARVQPESFRHLPGLENPRRPYFLASVRFIRRKNLTGLLSAYQLYREKVKSDPERLWRLVVLGDGEQRGFIDKTIRNNQLERDVILAGIHQIDEIPAYYAFAGVFIHPALQDQWGLVVNEAMACGLPVFVSNMSGCAHDLVQNGVNGYVFDPGDVESLAALMIEAANGTMDLETMGTQSRQIIASWGLEQFVDNMVLAVKKTQETK